MIKEICSWLPHNLDGRDGNIVCSWKKAIIMNIKNLQHTFCCCIYHSDNWFSASGWWQSWSGRGTNCWHYWSFIQYRWWGCPGWWCRWLWWRHQRRSHIMLLNKCSWTLSRWFYIFVCITYACHRPQLKHYSLVYTVFQKPSTFLIFLVTS